MFTKYCIWKLNRASKSRCWIASWNSSTTIFHETPTKKKTFDWHVFQQKWQQFPTKNPHQTLPSGRVESLRPEDRLWFETGPRWTLGNVQNLETHQMFHKVFSASSFQIKLSHLYKSESKTPMHNASYFTEYTFIYPVFAFLPAKVKNIMLQSCPH